MDHVCTSVDSCGLVAVISFLLLSWRAVAAEEEGWFEKCQRRWSLQADKEEEEGGELAVEVPLILTEPSLLSASATILSTAAVFFWQ